MNFSLRLRVAEAANIFGDFMNDDVVERLAGRGETKGRGQRGRGREWERTNLFLQWEIKIKWFKWDTFFDLIG
jgi:hypothetical protein